MKSAPPGRSPYLQGFLLQMRPACMFCGQVDLVWELVMSLAYSKIIGPQHTCRPFHPRIGVYKRFGMYYLDLPVSWRDMEGPTDNASEMPGFGRKWKHHLTYPCYLSQFHYYIKHEHHEPIRWVSGLPKRDATFFVPFIGWQDSPHWKHATKSPTVLGLSPLPWASSLVLAGHAMTSHNNKQLQPIGSRISWSSRIVSRLRL